MSNLEVDPLERECGGAADVASAPVRELLTGYQVALVGPRGLQFVRTLHTRARRMVGAWCFVDYYGPVTLDGTPGMRVPPHPHTGLQTVSWLVAGEILHRDSLGSRLTIRPGQLNLMTAGHGISHSEESPPAGERAPTLHGVQLWVALPAAAMATPPAFAHHADLPAGSQDGVTTTVVMGSLGGETSSAAAFTPLVGAELSLAAGAATRVPLEAAFEHAVLCLSGSAEVDGVPLAPGPLLYLGTGRRELAVGTTGPEPALLLLVGGTPFEEKLVMWWNFVGRSHEDVAQARADWESGTRFGTVVGYDGAPLRAPAMPATPLKPRGRER
jgi:redox-sensitive bicupin YhaK (pirin superfamily)